MMDDNHQRTQKTAKRQLSPDTNGNEIKPKRSRNIQEPSSEMSIHVLFRNQRAVGTVIGKGGASIQEIRSECDVSFSITTIQESQEQVGSLKGSPDGIQRALVMCAQLLAQGNDEDKKSITLLVENKNIGSLLGVKGACVKEIRARTKCRVFISPQTLGNSTQNVIEISGDNFDEAVASVINALSRASEQVRILYSPGGPAMGAPWKGYHPQMLSRGGGPQPRGVNNGLQQMRGNQWQASHPLLEGPWREEMKNLWGTNRQIFNSRPMADLRGDNGFSQLVRPRRAPIGRPRRLNEAGPQFGSRGMMGWRGFGALGKERPMAAAPHFREERILYVPSDIVPTIIGKGGAKIKRMRQMSRAKIFIENKEENPEAEDQKITISGERDRIEVAASMINEFAGGNVPSF